MPEASILGKREVLRRNPFCSYPFPSSLRFHQTMMWCLEMWQLFWAMRGDTVTEKEKTGELLIISPSQCYSLCYLFSQCASEYTVGIHHSWLSDIFLIITWYFGHFKAILPTYTTNPKIHLSDFLITRLRIWGYGSQVLLMWPSHWNLESEGRGEMGSHVQGAQLSSRVLLMAAGPSQSVGEHLQFRNWRH